jgi:hypothetical protein
MALVDVRYNAGMRAAIALALLTAAVVIAQEEPPVFDEAVKAVTEAVKQAAPERVRVDVEETTVEALGWRASRARCPARVLSIMTPSGAARAFGLLPREGTYTPLAGETQQLITIGPDLVIVLASRAPATALTLEAVEAARPLLDRASRPLFALDELPGAPPEVDARAFVRGTIERVDAHPYYLAVDLARGGSVDLAAAWRAGQRALVWTVRGEGFVPPTISFAPR